MLYIGISKDWGRRWMEHARQSPWFYDVIRLDIEWFDSAVDARAREDHELAQHQPVWNWAGTSRADAASA